MQGIQARMLQAQNEISTGNRIITPSDDPAAAADIVRLTGDKSESNQYLSNVGAAQSSLTNTGFRAGRRPDNHFSASFRWARVL